MSWEDELQKQVIPDNSKKAVPWENALRGANLAKKEDPSNAEGTLQFGPLNTGIKIPASVNNSLAGIGKAFSDFGQGVKRNIGIASADDVKETRQLDAPLMAKSAGFYGNMAGNTALLLPSMLAPGTATIPGAALLGGAFGALSPFEDRQEQAKNTAINAGGGMLGNIVGKSLASAYGIGKNAMQPLFEKGRDAMRGRLLEEFVKDPSRAVKALENGSKELVPGSMPTAAEAASADPLNSISGLAQLSKQIEQHPAGKQMFVDRNASNNAARVDAVRSVAGDVGEREWLAANRSAVSNKMYGDAIEKGLDPKAMTPEALANIATFYTESHKRQ